MKKTKLKTRLHFLYVFSFIFSIGPLLACLIVNWGDYTKTPTDTVKLCFGGILVILFIALKVVGKLHMPRRIMLFGIVFILSYLLKALLDDMILLSGMALLGELIDTVLFQRAIKTLKERMVIDKTAIATTEQVEAAIKKYIGRI